MKAKVFTGEVEIGDKKGPCENTNVLRSTVSHRRKHLENPRAKSEPYDG